jgi:hypothetical protein
MYIFEAPPCTLLIGTSSKLVPKLFLHFEACVTHYQISSFFKRATTTRVERPVIVHFIKVRFLAIFAREPHCLRCPISRWNPPLCAFITLKIGKNELEARKLPAPQIGGSFLQKNSQSTLHSLFSNPFKNLFKLFCCL